MTLLQVQALTAHYGDFQAVFGVDIAVDEGECVAIIGANGAGKSTLLRSIVGLHNQRGCQSLRFDGVDISTSPASRVATLGMTLVPEGRRLFTSLNVEENLRIGATVARPGRWTLEQVYELFPALRDLRRRHVSKLSGGQQQMVAVGRALMTNPRLLLCDEISLGLAPIIVRTMYQSFELVRRLGISMVIVEQDIGRALAVADRVYCMREGSVVLSGATSSFTRDEIAAAYFGIEGAHDSAI